ncbi:5549_t:CDS:1 [Acaulospora morrowiae]|uniref:5549_t:CDS:1 n=1 Tax=Acaulospora morrowiae TaxID=94023 RepID=A0A9N8YT65_9GLOM|nr:5549_t:CDS:1 [Acaulospora morrowiae]
MEEGYFSFIWKINCFNELVSRHPNGTFFYSERFWSPRGQTGKSINLNVRSVSGNSNNPNNTDYLWRLKLFPNGVDKKSTEFISLYLEAIQTQYEKQNGITGRHKKFRLALYRLDQDHLNTIQTPFLIIDRHILETNFEFNGVNADYGFARIINLKDLCPTESNLPEMDLMVRAQIFDDMPSHGEGSSASLIPECSSLSPFERFFSEKLFCDVEFVFDCGSSLKAHRVILAARSEYFERLLGGEWLEGHMRTITIKDMPFHAFRCIVYHLYTGKLEDGLSFDLLKDVYSKADMLNINELTSMTAEKMVEFISIENWDQILILGWKYYDDRLKTAGMNFAISNWMRIRNTDNMKQVMECGNMDWIEELVIRKFFSPVNNGS